MNPTTGQVVRTYPFMSAREVDRALVRACVAFEGHRRATLEDRAEKLRRVADILDAEAEGLAKLATLEMGKPLRQARAEVARCAGVCRHYAENGAGYVRDNLVQTEAAESFVRWEPLGPILAVMPWNFPYWQVFRFAAPALMAGNVCLLKHAPNVPMCAEEISLVFRRGGFDDDQFQNLLIEEGQVSSLLSDPRVKAVTLTGGESAGRAVASSAGGNLKPVVLELGGSDPFIVLRSADVGLAAAAAARARVVNNGQSCVAAKRIIVVQEVADEFEFRFVGAMEALRVGHPMNETTDVGPLATDEIRQRLEGQVLASVRKGARLLTGGTRTGGDGWFYSPTILADVPRDAPGRTEELFGPVACVIRVRDLDEALAVANETRFGLGSSVWTRDRGEQRRCIEELEAGLVFVNAVVSSDVRLPFGGVKCSGFGRELAEHGMRAFMNAKTVWVVDS